MRSIICGVLAAITLASPGQSLAHDGGSFQHKDAFLRAKVVHLHGKRAPGRDIVRWGMRSGRHATTGQVHRYFEQLRALIGGPYLSTRATWPRLAPAGTKSARLAPTGLASCIVSKESSGNPQAVNGQYLGIAQWSTEAWARHGGHRFAPTPLGATYEEQLQVLNDALINFGCVDFCPFDGC